MEWLNYHHLLYFWTVARAGGLAPAAAELRLAPPTLSGQIHLLEEALGEKLFVKQGRRLVLSEVGHLAFRYADEIFTLGRELLDTVHGRPTGRPVRLHVGVADVLPKLIARRLIQPALEQAQAVRLVCKEDKPERLIAELAMHELDVVLSDAPVGPGVSVRAYSHLLGDCGVSFFASPRLARRLARGFPKSLDGAPFLLPTDGTVLRRSLEHWFEREGIRPHVVAEIEDSALLKAFGQEGGVVYAHPSVIEDQLEEQYQVRVCGRAPEVRERYYAITVERRIQHPGVAAIWSAARKGLFAA